MTVKDKILRRIKGYGRGARVFSARDFLDIGARGTVDVTLSRLAGDGTLRRVGRGLYDWPRPSKLLRRDAPANTDAVLDAIKRRFNAKLAPDHAAAANKLGLTTAVSVQPSFLTDQRVSDRDADGLRLEFRPAGTFLSRWIGSDAAPIVQALFWLRDGGFPIDDAIPILRRKATKSARRALARGIGDLPTWAQKPARQIIANHVTD